MPTRFLLVDPINQQESKISDRSAKLVNIYQLLPLCAALCRWHGEATSPNPSDNKVVALATAPDAPKGAKTHFKALH